VAELDLNTLSLAELKKLQKSLEKAISEYEDRKKSEARAALEAQAREMGFSLAELTGTTATKKTTRSAAKYHHPENSSITWTGRGRKPKWFEEALAAGKSPEDMAI